LSTFAVNDTEELPFPGVAVPIVGAPGTVAGTNVFDAADGALVPATFVAVAVHVYVLPFVSAVTMIGLAVPDPVPVAPPPDEAHVRSKCVTGLPPLFAPAVNKTETAVFPGDATKAVGASGADAKRKPFDAPEDALWPIAFVAVMVHV